MEKRVFAFWTGSNPMSEARRKSLASLTATGCPVTLVDGRNLHHYIAPDNLHPAYPHLNLAHRADYLRCYFMLRYGGGYTDLKPTATSWQDAFELLEARPELWAVGYPEVGPRGVANLYRSSQQMGDGLLARMGAYARWRALRRRHRLLIGLCAFVFRPDTALAGEWWAELNRRLDLLLPALRAHPAQLPRERPGDPVHGARSRYPVPWTYLLGDIFHPLVLKHHRRVARTLPAPGFQDYL